MSKMEMFSRIIVILTLAIVASGSGIGKAWDVSPALQPNSHRLSWPRVDSSPLEVRTISGVGRIPQQFRDDFGTEVDPTEPHTNNQRQSRRKEILQDDKIDFEMRERKSKSTKNSMDFSDFEEIVPLIDDEQFKTTEQRVRRDTEPKMEKIAGTKNVREARLSSPDSWSKQPISVEFRHRMPLDQINPEEEDTPMSSRRSSGPEADFVTSNRRYFAESRESREMPVARTYDDYDVPIYHSPAREYDVPIPRNYYYPDPNRYRTERDYRYRGDSMPPPYIYDQYPENNFEHYERNRPVSKPKRIIYYATLPEIVRKPDLPNYPRPYDGPSRVPPASSASRNSITGRKHVQEPIELSRRPYFRYPYDAYNYDGYRRPGFYDRSASLHKESGRRNPQERNIVPSHKENLRMADDSNENSSQERKTRDNQDLPWPVQIGTEVSVKENERIPGRKIFGQLDSYDRYESARVEKTPNESNGDNEQDGN